MFSYIADNHIKKGGKVLVITDRIELLKQASGAFGRIGLIAENIKAGNSPDLMMPLTVAMTETLYRRADKYSSFLSKLTLIIIDEAHRTSHDKLFPYFSDSAYVIGATATPYRKGNQSSMDVFYQDIVQEVDTTDLVEMGFLSSARSYGVDIDLSGIKKKGGDWDANELGKRYSERKVYDGVIENYKRICPNTKAIAFAPNVASSKELCAKFNESGVHSMHLDGSMNKTDREFTLKWFNDTPNGVLVNCSVLTTGFDQPDIKTVILYRATTSLPLFLQMVGRGSRVTDNKKDFFLLDFGNNIKTHDFWEAPRQWGLKKVVKKKKKDVAPVKNCPSCQALIPVSAQKCKWCGNEIKLTKKEKEKKEMAFLIELPKPERLKKAKEATLERKAEMCKAGAIKAAWVLHNLTDRAEALRFVDLMGYKSGWYHYNKNRFKVFEG